MSGITENHVYRGDPSRYAKQLAIISVLAVIGILLVGYFGLKEKNPKFYLFMCGVAIVVALGRYFSMMGLHGPAALVIGPSGVKLQGHNKSTEVNWADLRSIRSVATRGGMLWEVAYAQGKFEYFTDGLTGQQKDELKKTIGSINLPHVEVRLEHYDQT